MSWVVVKDSISAPERRGGFFSCLMGRGQNYRSNVTIRNGAGREVTLSVRVLDRYVHEQDDGLEELHKTSEVYLDSNDSSNSSSVGRHFSMKSLVKQLKKNGLDQGQVSSVIDELSLELLSSPATSKTQPEASEKQPPPRAPSSSSAPSPLTQRNITQLPTKQVKQDTSSSKKHIKTYLKVDNLLADNRITLCTTPEGKGGFGSIYKGFIAGKTRSAPVVLKKLDKPEDLRKNLNRGEKLSLLAQTSLKIYGLIVGFYIQNGEENPQLVRAYVKSQPELEFLQNNTSGLKLFHIVQENGGVSLARAGIRARGRDIPYILYDILDDLRKLHEKGLVHKDIKFENVVLDSQTGLSKLIDFGMLEKKDKSGKIYKSCGTPGFLAPEVRCKLPHDEKADMWSFGILALQLLLVPLIVKDPNFKNNIYQPFAQKIINNFKMPKDERIRVIAQFLKTHLQKIYPNSNFPLSKDILTKLILCLALNPENRPSAEELLKGVSSVISSLESQTSNPIGLSSASSQQAI